MSKAAELAALIGSQTALSNRNLIINGAMQVAQRGDVTGVTTGYGGADRYQFARAGAAEVTLSQDTDVPSNQGFAYSQKVDVTTADSSLAADDYALLLYRMEGFDCQQFLYGTNAAKKVTVQFWVKSPKTGTHIVEAFHGDASYHNSQSYTIATANTWQKVTLTFDGYQTTAFDNDNGFGLQISWWLASGTTYASGTLTEDAWHNTNANRAVGQVNVMDSTSNAFYLTGFQLEVGEQATSFEHRSFADELYRCKRYYNDIIPSNSVALAWHIAGNSSVNRRLNFSYPEMRATPSATFSSSSVGSYGTNYPALNNPSNKFTEVNMSLSANSDSNYTWLTAMSLDAEL